MRKEPLAPELQALLGEYIAEGLIPSQFQPIGEFDHARRKSIESKAYITWLQKNRDLTVGRDVEVTRTMFLKRHDRSWDPPPLETLEPLIAPEPARGFDTAAASLPKGDAYEPEDLFAEDEPPPLE